MLEITVGTDKFTLSDEEVKALETNIISREANISAIGWWVKNAIKEKARRTMDAICDKLSDKKVSKMTQEEKDILIRGASLETAIEREARIKLESEE